MFSINIRIFNINLAFELRCLKNKRLGHVYRYQARHYATCHKLLKAKIETSAHS